MLGIAGACVGLLLAGQVHARIGPLDTTFSARPSLAGRTHIELAPLGALVLRTHDGPARVDVRVDRIRLADAQRLLQDPQAVNHLADDVTHDAHRGLVRLVQRCLWVTGLSGALGAAVRRPHWTSVLAGGVIGVTVTGAALGVAALTFRPNAISEPHYTGLLTLAPKAIGDVKDVTSKFSTYRGQLTTLVNNVSQLYQTTEALPATSGDDNTIRILHVSDLHLNPAGFDLIDQVVKQFGVSAVIDTGDINDWGTTFETSFVQRIGKVGVPYVFIRGNHDSADTQAAVAAQPNAVVLDNRAATVAGLRIWGIGDPRFTPDKTLESNPDQERQQAQSFAPQVATGLQANEPPAVDIALVHDPSTATRLGGLTPLVLAGHLHHRDEQHLGSTLVLVEGSTGAAGLRTAESGNPLSLDCSVLYFDRTTHRLKAEDQITVDGLGSGGARIERQIFGG